MEMPRARTTWNKTFREQLILISVYDINALSLYANIHTIHTQKQKHTNKKINQHKFIQR